LDGIQSVLPQIEVNNIQFKLGFYSTRDTNPATQGVGLLLVGYQCSVENCNFEGGDIGLDLQFSLGTRVINNEFKEQTLFGMAIRNGQWFGAALANAQSNVSSVEGAKFRLGDQLNVSSPPPQFAAIYVADSSDCRLFDITLEGGIGGAAFKRCEYGIIYDSIDGASVVKDLHIYNVHIEKLFNNYVMQFRCTPDTVIFVDKVSLITTESSLIDFGAGPIIDTAGNPVFNLGTPHIVLKRFPYKPVSGDNFRSTSSAAIWRFEDVMVGTAPQPQNPADFVAASVIWDTTPANIPFYDGFYASPSWNTIVNVPVTGVIPNVNRIAASNLI
jgi:hypothetical protein